MAAVCAVVIYLLGPAGLTSARAASGAPASKAAGVLTNFDHIIVIYQENWSFDGLYGHFPNARGIADATNSSTNQIDRVSGNSVATLPIFNPVKNKIPTNMPPVPLNDDSPPQLDVHFLTNVNGGTVTSRVDTLLPYDLGDYIDPTNKTGDLVHRYWQEQFQIDHGRNDKFVTWSDNPGLVMSHYDASDLPEGRLAQQYTMCDNYFHSAFGGSFFNHQYLIAAQPPVYPGADKLDPNDIAQLENGTGLLATDPTNNRIIHDGPITPIGGVIFANTNLTFDRNYAVNTVISINLANANITASNRFRFLPSLNDSDPSDPVRPYIPTIGDRLDAAGVSWKWYSGQWDRALAVTASNPANTNSQGNDADPDFNDLFQWHHQPFVYYDHYAPWINGVRNPRSAAHLQDEANFFADVASTNLPSVCFIKPFGTENEHPGYASLMEGQLHVSNLVAQVQSNQTLWAHSLIIITYDEHGGRWDHVAPPQRDIWGPGVRVPAIIISPLPRITPVDHRQYETLSILKTIEQRFGVQPLTAADAAANSFALDFDPSAASQP